MVSRGSRPSAGRCSVARGQKKHWWIVVGRVAYDDEDACGIYKASNEREAISEFKQELRDARDNPNLGKKNCDEYDQVYVNYTIRCGDRPEPVIVTAP